MKKTTLFLPAVVALVLCAASVKGQETDSKHHIEFSVGEPLTTMAGINLMHVNSSTGEALRSEWGKTAYPTGHKTSFASGWRIPTFSLN